MTTDFYKQVIFSDGEGLVHTDLNNIQKYLTSKILDQILHNQIGQLSFTGLDPEFSGFDGVDHSSAYAYCLNPGAAFLRPGSGNNKIQISPGVLIQKSGNVNGADAVLMMYSFVGTEEFTIASGDPTSPRVDLLQMQLTYINGDSQSRDFEDATTRVVTSTSFNKSRQINCALTVKQGTPAASPVTPEPDAGCVPVGSVVVGNGWTSAVAPTFGLQIAATNNAIVMDQRMPLNVKAYFIDPVLLKPVTAWTLSSSKDSLTSSNVTNDVYANIRPALGRIVSVRLLHGSLLTAPTFRMGIAPFGLVSGWLQSHNLGTPVAGRTQFTSPFYTFEGQHTPNAGCTVQPAPTSKFGVPMWGNGTYCARESIRLDGVTLGEKEILSFKHTSGATGTVMAGLTVFVAEGL